VALLRMRVAVAVSVLAVAEAKQAAGGFWVLRPDSGDPVEVVIMVRGTEPVRLLLPTMWCA